MPAADPRGVAQVVDHLFRREFGRLVAILARRFGASRLHLAEDVVQDALARAMQVWPYTGVPDNPSAWLLQTARHRALDTLRRDHVLARKAPALAPLIEDCAREALAASPPQFEDEIADSQLRMMFVCCQPTLPADAQVALVLKTLCGFGEREIAAAFLSTDAAVTKKLVRARKLLRDARIAVELPPATRLAPRVAIVLTALYLLFNEGYKASQGDALLRADLCAEAIRLGELLAAHPLGRRPETHALLALMYFNSARLATRTDEAGALLRLAVQDRTKWNRFDIRHGMAHLGASGEGTHLTRYHLEAGIAACHCLAPSYAETNWPRIVSLYESLREIADSPIVALNRAIALAQMEGPEAGLRALAKIPRRRSLEQYHLLHAAAGQFLLDAGRSGEAAEALRRAHTLAPTAAERELLAGKLAALGDKAGA